MWVEPRLDEAVARFEAGDYDGAAELLRALADESPARGDLRFQYAYALHKAGQSEAARPHAERAVALDPDSQDATYLAGLSLRLSLQGVSNESNLGDEDSHPVDRDYLRLLGALSLVWESQPADR